MKSVHREQDLLTQIAGGQESAVRDFIDRYGGLLWSLAQRFSATPMDAEDAVQEVFLELWTKADRFRPEIASEKTFVTMVARRRLIDRARAKRLQRSPGLDLDRLHDHAILQASEALETREDAQLAQRLLSQLPEAQSRAIRLSIYGRLTHAQIATATGLSLGIVKTQIRRGLMKLRERIASRLDGEGSVA